MDKRETGDQDPAATSDPPFPAQIRPEIASLQTSGIAQLSALGPGRGGLIALWVGEGDLPTPGFICEAAVRALGAGKTFYTDKRASRSSGRPSPNVKYRIGKSGGCHRYAPRDLDFLRGSSPPRTQAFDLMER